jgi:hypothetical protein
VLQRWPCRIAWYASRAVALEVEAPAKWTADPMPGPRVRLVRAMSRRKEGRDV